MIFCGIILISIPPNSFQLIKAAIYGKVEGCRIAYTVSDRSDCFSCGCAFEARSVSSLHLLLILYAGTLVMTITMFTDTKCNAISALTRGVPAPGTRGFSLSLLMRLPVEDAGELLHTVRPSLVVRSSCPTGCV